MQLLPLSLYIHIPWCIKKCPYCDFNSHAQRDDLPQEAYINALLRDLQEDLHLVHGRPIQSIFIGGGTPSLFHAKMIEHLLSGIQDQLTLTPNCEITMEANPGSMEHGSFVDYRTAGVTRISLGVQSFQPHLLKTLGRIHDDKQAKRAIEAIQAADFQTFNVDIMHTLPRQTVEEAIEDLSIALSFGTPHLSWYQLTLEPNTLFYAKPPKLPNELTQSAIETEGLALLNQHVSQYEVSAYAKPGHESQHNLNYWTFGDYLGIGAGAHSKLTDQKGDILRLSKHRHPKAYLQAKEKWVQTKRTLKKEDLTVEFMLNALRLTHGFDLGIFESRTGLPLHTLSGPLKAAENQGLISIKNKHLDITPLGKKFLDDLVSLF